MSRSRRFGRKPCRLLQLGVPTIATMCWHSFASIRRRRLPCLPRPPEDNKLVPSCRSVGVTCYPTTFAVTSKVKRPKTAAERRARVDQILLGLDKMYPNVTCALLHKSPWELLVATILSA